MKNNILDSEVFIGRSAPTRMVTRELLQARTRELAFLAGRAIPHVTHADYAQAKRELTGESDPDRQDALIEGMPEHKAPAPDRELPSGDSLYLKPGKTPRVAAAGLVGSC